MNKDILNRALELCLAVYRVTDKFPRGEVLGSKLRGLAIDITECLVYNRATPTSSSRFLNCQDFEQKFRVLFSYFAVAEKQGWVDARNFRVLEQAYRDFYRTVINSSGSDPDELKSRSEQQSVVSRQQPPLSSRQAEILEFLRDRKEEGRVIADIAGKIKASNKTVERELKKMIAAGFVHKQGNTKGARFISDK